LYRRFDVLMLRPSDAASVRTRRADRVKPDATTLTGVVARFSTRTLWRSPLHQVVFLGVTACGVGWTLNGLLSGGLLSWLRDGGVPAPQLVAAVTRMPFVLLLAGVTGLRAALMLPQDPRANWIFRLREDDGHRPAQLDAVERLFMRLVVWPVLVCSLPLHWAVLGADALTALPIAFLAGVILLELVIIGWRRIPFTCGYIPGKRNVAQTFLLALITYVFFTTIGAGLTASARFHPSRFLMVMGILLMTAALIRRYRLRSWGEAPLMFDDDPPELAQPLQLL
jgi:hypothetical protein